MKDDGLHKADLDVDGWELEDAVQQHAENPETFKIPSEHERKGLKAGDVVKMIFLFLDHDDEGEVVQGERMHVTVRERHGGEYVGVLEDEPGTSERIHRGARIVFGPEHVATVVRREA